MNIDVSDSSRVESSLFSTLLPVSVLKSRLLHVQLQLYYTKGSLICYRACQQCYVQFNDHLQSAKG